MTTPDKITDTDLNSYVDGELDHHAALNVEAWIADHPEDAAKVESYRQQKKSLHDLFDPVSEEPIPEAMLKITAMPLPLPYKFQWWQVAAAILLLSVGTLLGWKGNAYYQSPQLANLPSYVDRAVGAHVVYAAEILHPVEVTADQETHLVKWLSKRLGQPLQPPSLTDLGYVLMGGRLLEEAALPAAQFMYEDKTGQRLTVYVRANEAGDSSFKFFEDNNANAFYWIDTPFAYALVGDIPRPELMKIAQAVYDSLGY